MRVVPRLNDKVNQVWLADRDRFAFLSLHSETRLDKPMIRDGKTWRTVSWDAALTLVAEKMQAVLKAYGPEQIGALISPNATVEEGFICQKLCHALGCSNMDYRHHQIDTDYVDHDSEHHPLGYLDFAEVDVSKVMLFVGSDIRSEQPIAAMRVRQAVQKGLQVLRINPVCYDWHMPVHTDITVQAWDMITTLSACVLSLQQQLNVDLSDSWRKCLAGIKPTASSDTLAKQLRQGKGYIILGRYAQSHEQATIVHKLCKLIASMTQLTVVHMTPGTNATGLHHLGFGPSHRVDNVNITTGVSSYQMIDIPRKLYLLQQVELEYEHYDAQLASNALEKAHTVIAITSFVSPKLQAHADILLPAAAWSEFSGTWVSACGEMQSFSAVKTMHADSKSIWKIYRVLANLLKLKGFNYHDIQELRRDIPLITNGLVLEDSQEKTAQIKAPPRRCFQSPKTANSLQRIADVPLYATDAMVRRSQPLQDIAPQLEQVRIHTQTQIDSRIQDGDTVVVRQGRQQLRCQLHRDDQVAVGGVCLPAAVNWTLNMGGRCAEIHIEYDDKEADA